MIHKVNPFHPNSTFPPGSFVGRLDEITAIEKCLLQAREENPVNLLITGERGIGKTSLLQYAEFVADGSIDVGKQRFKFLNASVSLSSKTTRSTLIKLIQREIDRKLAKTEKARAFLGETWGFVKRLEAAGVKLNQKEQEAEDELALDDFAWAVSETAKRLKSNGDSLWSSNYDGISILIDEADNVQPEVQLGEFIKILIERLQRNGAKNVFFIVCGLPSVRNVLKASHESSLRLFEEHVLDRLDDDEVSMVIDRCLNSSKEKSGIETKIEADARKQLIYFSEGYPHFIQQFGYSAFDYDKDGSISLSDVIAGGLAPNGALEQIGSKYYSDDFFKRIKSDSYRQVLRVMAEDMDGWVSRVSINEKFSGKDTTLNNALTVLVERGIVQRDASRKGFYRLQQKGFAWWIRLLSDSQEKQKRNLAISKKTRKVE